MSATISPRIERLKQRLLAGELPKPVHSEAFTRAYRQHENGPPLSRLAKAMREAWLAMPIVVGEDELLVGGNYLQAIAGYHYCGGGLFCDRALAERLKQTRDPAAVREMDDVLAYWQDRTTSAVFSRRLAAEGIKLPGCLAWGSAGGCAHLIPDFAKALMLGLKTLKKQLYEKILAAGTDAKKLDFYHAMITLCDGMMSFARRHGQKAAELAAQCSSAERRAELERIAAICQAVPSRPALTFHEALQSFWFVHLLEGVGRYGVMLDSPGRFDQYLYPYYKLSLERGELTRDQAQELVDCFWLKANEPSVSWNLCIGGQRPTGEDATNEVTYLCLSAAERLRLQKPNLSFRWHSGTPDSALKRALQVVRLGTGFPAIYNDESLVPALTAIGVTLEDARDYAMGGCSEVSVSAKSHYGNEDGDISITKPLEYALHNGFCVMHKCREGAETGDVATFKTFDDVLTAYKRQVEFCIALLARYCNLGQQARAEHAPRLVKTLLTDDCLERAQTIDAGGARYNGGQFFVIGLANAADSLAAIKKVVFEEKRLSLSDLVAILDRNFEGHEPLRQQLLNAVPKFGNDDPYVDSIMADVAAHCFTTIKQQRAWRGGVYGANVIVLERNIIFGKSLAATPDGRLAGSPVSDSIGPMQGADRQGPTATINSIGRIDQTLAPGGVILNLKFSPKALEGEDGLDKLAALLKRYFALKGQQVQITVVDKATLLAAQREPHNYRHLLVRVGGFSGRFVDFSDELQRQVIARTEHAL